ncbi:hypothetical protein ASPVEDRAFT_533959 [Aspergillus versicolor CBS 583.65]|uniref:Uncharacterized protein n=1 Tax=Aspergillus versicolor CBS 583.65 TaxID=1036611 RepID=A0A1L9PEQ2_ASPVE|nr:uncharacterized protein ASPVEDRAFT_533959 [Aspergillus versicolor CBS 583.65]OJI99925.1 hypothetical protein ASPVEDRAFT_533959 [Aspergillus versicolor CBS 583.65]
MRHRRQQQRQWVASQSKWATKRMSHRVQVRQSESAIVAGSSPLQGQAGWFDWFVAETLAARSHRQSVAVSGWPPALQKRLARAINILGRHDRQRRGVESQGISERFGVVKLEIVPAGKKKSGPRGREGGECQVVEPDESREQGRKVLNRRPWSSRARPHSSAQLALQMIDYVSKNRNNMVT